MRFLALFLLAWVGLRMMSFAMEAGFLMPAGEDRRQLVIEHVVTSDADLRHEDSSPPTEDGEVVPQQMDSQMPEGLGLRARQVASLPESFLTIKAWEALAMQSASNLRRGHNVPAAGWSDSNPTGGAAASPMPLVLDELMPDVDAALAGKERYQERKDIRDTPGTVEPVAIRHMAGWSLSAWALLREKGSVPSLPYALVAGELAGSQGGMRLAYGFGKEGRLRAYGRATMALERWQQSEAAIGLTYAPVATVPLDIAVERRVKLGREGRSAMAAMVVGGVSGKPLPHNFRLDAYGQAGFVGLRSRDAFADGAVVVDRAWDLSEEGTSLRIGAMVTGAAQPGLSRVDVGPRVTLPLPAVGKGARVAVDWRQRIAGNAEPQRGFALTLGVDF